MLLLFALIIAGKAPLRTPAGSAVQYWAQIDQKHNRKQEKDGYFVEDPIKNVGLVVFTAADPAHINAGLNVVDDQSHDPDKFSDHPARRQVVLPLEAQPPKAKCNREHHKGCDEAIEFVRHQCEDRFGFGVGALGVVHEDAGQIEDACKPADDENYVKPLYPQHVNAFLSFGKKPARP